MERGAGRAVGQYRQSHGGWGWGDGGARVSGEGEKCSSTIYFLFFCQVLVLVFLVVFRRSLRPFPPHLYFRNEGIFVRTNRVGKALRGAIILILKNKKKILKYDPFVYSLLSVPWTSPLFWRTRSFLETLRFVCTLSFL